MKKNLLSIAFLTAIIFSFRPDPNPLIGRWEIRGNFSDGPFHFVYAFRADSTVDGILDDKPFVSGKYFVSGDTLNIADPICNYDYYGRYHLKFYGQDSVTMTKISDTCMARVSAMDGATVKKVKKTTR